MLRPKPHCGLPHVTRSWGTLCDNFRVAHNVAVADGGGKGFVVIVVGQLDGTSPIIDTIVTPRRRCTSRTAWFCGATLVARILALVSLTRAAILVDGFEIIGFVTGVSQKRSEHDLVLERQSSWIRTRPELGGLAGIPCVDGIQETFRCISRIRGSRGCHRVESILNQLQTTVCLRSDWRYSCCLEKASQFAVVSTTWWRGQSLTTCVVSTKTTVTFGCAVTTTLGTLYAIPFRWRRRIIALLLCRCSFHSPAITGTGSFRIISASGFVATLLTAVFRATRTTISF